MSFKNTAEKFGSLTKSLHWIIFVLVMTEFFLVYRRGYFPENAPEKTTYILLHKSFGVCILLLALFFIASHYLGKRPSMPSNMSALEVAAAKFTHFVLYVALLFMPISGITMSLLGGHSVSVFGLVNLPNFLAKNKALGGVFYNAHVWCSYVIIAFVSAHVLASLYHHFIKKDVVLKRMLPFG